MRKIYLFLLLALLMTGCKDDFSVSNLPDAKPKMVVYCMPSTADTTYITVLRSVPLKQYNAAQPNVLIDNATISYQLNGQSLPVTAVGQGRYYVVGQQKAGDKVHLQVEAQGLETVESTTEIPQPVAISSTSTRMVRMKEYPSSYLRDFLQVQASFTDPAQSHDYYAVRVKIKRLMSCRIDCFRRDIVGDFNEVATFFDYDNYLQVRQNEQWDSVAVNYLLQEDDIPIYTASEPLLNPLSDIDDDFDFSSDFYQDFYIFDDATINGREYTLHLNVQPNTELMNLSDEALKEMKERYGIEQGFILEFYHLTPEYYRFLQALNDVSNNSLAQAGLSSIRTTYSNVLNGMGICAAYNLPKGTWVQVKR